MSALLKLLLVFSLYFLSYVAIARFIDLVFPGQGNHILLLYFGIRIVHTLTVIATRAIIPVEK